MWWWMWWMWWMWYMWYMLRKLRNLRKLWMLWMWYMWRCMRCMRCNHNISTRLLKKIHRTFCNFVFILSHITSFIFIIIIIIISLSRSWSSYKTTITSSTSRRKGIIMICSRNMWRLCWFTTWKWICSFWKWINWIKICRSIRWVYTWRKFTAFTFFSLFNTSIHNKNKTTNNKNTNNNSSCYSSFSNIVIMIFSRFIIFILTNSFIASKWI